MNDDRLNRRALRVLGALSSARHALLRGGGSSAWILDLDGKRHLRCPKGLIETMIERGWIHRRRDPANDADHVALTDDGKLWRSRALAGGDFAAQHRTVGTIAVPGAGTFTGNLSESPLARLATPRAKGQSAWLDAAQLGAGERLRSDFEFGQLGQKVTASWDAARTVRDRSAGQGTADLPDRAIDARTRFNNALEKVGPELAGVLVDVCCFLKGLEQVEAERGWPRRSAKVLLRAALAALDRHYDPKPVGNGGIRRWGGPGYRPPITT